MEIKCLIKACGIRVGLDTQSKLAKRIGMPPPTFSKKLKNQELFTGHEIGTILRVTNMDDSDRLELLKELERRSK